MLRRLLLLLLLATVAGPAGAQPGVPRLLLHLRTHNSSTFLCQGGISEYLIFRDGLVVGRTHQDLGLLRLDRTMGSAESLVRMRRELARHHVGFAEGDCRLGLFLPNAGFESTITWFGRRPRSNTFTVVDAGGPGSPCPDATEAIFAAIGDYLNAALANPALQSEHLPAEPAEGCEDAAP